MGGDAAPPASLGNRLYQSEPLLVVRRLAQSAALRVVETQCPQTAELRSAPAGVSPVQTMPPWDQMGVPIHFHSSRISGSASCTISRTFASVFPRQSPSSLILSSINAEADSTGTGPFMHTSNSRTYFSCAQRLILPSCPLPHRAVVEYHVFGCVRGASWRRFR